METIVNIPAVIADVEKIVADVEQLVTDLGAPLVLAGMVKHLKNEVANSKTLGAINWTNILSILTAILQIVGPLLNPTPTPVVTP